MSIEFCYSKNPDCFWFICNNCKRETTVANTGYIYIGFGKVLCLNCATKEEIVERWRELGGRDPGAKEWDQGRINLD